MKTNKKQSFRLNTRLEPVSAKVALGEKIVLREPRLFGEWVLWLEQRPNESGRTTILIRPWGKSECIPQELTPFPIDIRTRVHTYGGGAVAIGRNSDELLLTWINDLDGSLWMQPWNGLLRGKVESKEFLQPSQAPICLSSQDDYLLADGLLDVARMRWIGVMEAQGRDYLVSFALNQENQKPKILHSPSDFIGYSSLSCSGSEMAWIEWRQPFMPWEESYVWWACLNEDGNIREKKKLIVSHPGESSSSPISFFQPIWLSTGELVVAEDSNGWWNLSVWDGGIAASSLLSDWRRLWTVRGESAMPQWIYGMSTNSSTGNRIVTSVCNEARWSLYKLSIEDCSVEKIQQPFDDLSYLSISQDKLVAIASNSFTEPGLLELDLSSGSWSHSPIRDEVIQKEQISVPQDFWFEGYEGKKTHSWYYPPLCSKIGPAPLLVKSHSGPTGMANKGLNLEIQFWTSRGWGVVDVNYGGSTGFGREYRERLNRRWGEVDVFDCVSAAKALIEAGRADERYLAIEGGSAGGFTTLSCLCFSDTFKAGACRYAVSDLEAMNHETHRFEAGYLNHLVGLWPEEREKYYEFSPLNHADKINCPVIFFQGLKDKVVLPNQTQKMVDALRKNHVPVEIHSFPQEGHGFRNVKVKVEVLESTEKFFKKHLGL